MASAGLGSVFLAGCSSGSSGNNQSGGDSDGSDGGGGSDGSSDTTTTSGSSSNRVTMLTSPPGTLGNAMGNGMMSLFSQETEYSGSASAGSGSIQNIVEVMRGEADLSRGVTSVLWAAYNGEDPVNVDAEYQPLQLISHQYLRAALVCKTSDDFEYVSDLSGSPVARGPQAASFQPALDLAYNAVMDDHNDAYQAPNEMAPALAAGNVKASIIMNTNGAMPSFAQEVASRSSTRLLGWKEENIQQIRDMDNVTGVMQANDFWDGVDEFVMSPDTFMPSVNYSMISSAATSSEVVYTFLDTIFSNRDGLPDIHAGFGPWTDEEWYTRLVDPRIPFHPGAAEFLRDNDLWSDDFQEADV
ncbi:TAXI family TRAP transporter solute-binding subunit [Halobellus sp. GM3]|uniref:TAXI family TRAP transporter solute-binding subunit n=1 Tax=Halobellus sp. GM3 TaxID=3458410 RepID=UPI00403D8FAF